MSLILSIPRAPLGPKLLQVVPESRMEALGTLYQ